MIPRKAPSGPNIKLVSAPGIISQTVGATATIDWSLGPNQALVLSGPSTPCSITSVGLPANESASLTLQITQGSAGTQTVVFVDGDKATPFTLSTAGGSVDLVDLLWTGVGLLASIRGKNYA